MEDVEKMTIAAEKVMPVSDVLVLSSPVMSLWCFIMETAIWVCGAL
jgi:hypothetical protein